MKKKDPFRDKKTDRKIKDGDVPGTLSKQNLGHNSKKEGLGPNTYR